MSSDLLELLVGLGPALFFFYLWWRALSKPWGQLLTGRFAGWLIDIFVVFAVLLVWWGIAGRPTEGPLEHANLAGVVFVAYILLRDVRGASVGKLVLKLRVVGDGPLGAGVFGRVIRNAPLALYGIREVWFEDIFLMSLVAGLLLWLDILVLLLGGKRLGDMIAGTTVVRRDDLQSAGG